MAHPQIHIQKHEKRNKHTLVRVTGANGGRRTPMFIYGVVDKSGSMYKRRLREAILGLIKAVQNARNGDVIRIDVFEIKVRNVFELTVTDENKLEMISRIKSIKAEDGTNFENILRHMTGKGTMEETDEKTWYKLEQSIHYGVNKTCEKEVRRQIDELMERVHATTTDSVYKSIRIRYGIAYQDMKTLFITDAGSQCHWNCSALSPEENMAVQSTCVDLAKHIPGQVIFAALSDAEKLDDVFNMDLLQGMSDNVPGQSSVEIVNSDSLQALIEDKLYPRQICCTNIQIRYDEDQKDDNMKILGPSSFQTLSFTSDDDPAVGIKSFLVYSEYETEYNLVLSYDHEGQSKSTVLTINEDISVDNESKEVACAIKNYEITQIMKADKYDLVELKLKKKKMSKLLRFVEAKGLPYQKPSQAVMKWLSVLTEDIENIERENLLGNDVGGESSQNSHAYGALVMDAYIRGESSAYHCYTSAYGFSNITEGDVNDK